MSQHTGLLDKDSFFSPSGLEMICNMSHRSIVSDLIKYDFLDELSWRDPMESIPTEDQMIDQIIDFQKQWDHLKTMVDADHIKVVQERFIDRYCDTNTDPIKDESEQEKKRRESDNLKNLIEYFDEIVAKEKEQRDAFEEENQLNCGLMEKSILQKAHEIAVKYIKIKNGCTRPGNFSDNPRYTEFRGEIYRYQQPDDMDEAVDLVSDRFNSLIHGSRCETDKRKKLKDTFKSLAWFLFEILDLHPFGNGNGRLFRTVCYYVLSSDALTVVPCPLYHTCIDENDHSNCPKPCKDIYEEALVEARKSDTRHPRKLATMLIESCWKTWVEFMKAIQEQDQNHGYCNEGDK